MRIDVHTHHYPPEFFRLIERAGGEFAFGTDPTGQRIITYRGSRFFGVTAPMTDLDRRFADMDEAGMDLAVVSLSTPNVYFVEGKAQTKVARLVNDAYADAIAKHPDRLRGFASIPMDDPDAALRELHRALGELRMSGVILLSNIRGRPLTDPRYRPFLEEADRMKACVFLHPMIPAADLGLGEYVLGPIVGFPFDTTLAVARLCYAGVFRELPNIRWIVGHLGGAIPYLFSRLDTGYRDFAECRANIDRPPSEYLRRLYYDTVSFSPAALRMVREQVGTDHMALGSDYPHKLGDIRRSVAQLGELGIGADEVERIGSGTARAILAGL